MRSRSWPRASSDWPIVSARSSLRWRDFRNEVRTGFATLAQMISLEARMDRVERRLDERDSTTHPE